MRNLYLQIFIKILHGVSVELAVTRMDSQLSQFFSVKIDQKNSRLPKIIQTTVRSLKSKSILIVDDSLDNLEIIRMFLASYGGDADVAADGKEALLKMREQKYDVVLMDIEMPKMNGFQLIKELQDLKYKTPVIALTAHAMPEDRQKTKNAGFFDHVTKPIDFDRLVKVIENS